MTEESTALAGLQEIGLPPPVPYVPQTIGWLVVAVVLLGLVAYFVWRALRSWRANAYRREAAAELETIATAFRTNHPEAIAKLPELLKRTAIAATSREKVAALTGTEWLDFLDRTLGGDAFRQGVGARLTQIAYADRDAQPALGPSECDELLGLARSWIDKHHADV